MMSLISIVENVVENVSEILAFAQVGKQFIHSDNGYD